MSETIYPSFPSTYSASTSGLTLATACTDLASIVTDGTKALRLRQVVISGIATANDSTPVIILKRSTVNTGGTPTSMTVVPHDSTSPTSVATVRFYTANPTTGTLIGNICESRLILAKATASGGSGDCSVVFYFGKNDYARAPSILLSTETLCLNLAGGTVPSGAAIDISFLWTEENLP